MASTPAVEVICEGTPEQMGLQQGEAFAPRIRAGRRALAQLEAFRIAKPKWLPYWAWLWLAEAKAVQLIAGPLERECPALHRRLHGIAAASGARPRSLYLLSALEPLMSYVGDMTTCIGGCSAVAVRGRRSAGGEPMVAKNFDFLPLLQPFYTLRESRPADGLRSLDFLPVFMPGAVDGLNEAGLCITYDYAFTADGAKSPGVPLSMRIAEALQRFSTVAEAADWIAAQPRWGGGLLMLADADGDIASLEISSTRSHLRRPAAGEDVVFHSNRLCCAPMQEVQLPPEAVFDHRAPAALRGRRLHESSEVRDARLGQLLAGDACLDPESLRGVMADHGPQAQAGERTLCVHGSYWSTTASLQYFPRQRRIRAAFDSPCRARYVELSL